jgi:hypothetical protein
MALINAQAMSGLIRSSRPAHRSLHVVHRPLRSDCQHGTPADYDFLTGLWEFRFQNRQPDGTFGEPFTGHWSALKRSVGPNNGMIEDHWRADAATNPWDVGTYTYRVYSPERKLWTFQGVHSNVGFWQPGLSWSDENNRYIVEWYDGFLMRMRYFAITPTAFLWRGDVSRDRGKTWTRDWWIMEGRRIGK